MGSKKDEKYRYLMLDVALKIDLEKMTMKYSNET